MKHNTTITDTTPTEIHPVKAHGRAAPPGVEYMFSVLLVDTIRDSLRRRCRAAGDRAKRMLDAGQGPFASRLEGVAEGYMMSASIMSSVLESLRSSHPMRSSRWGARKSRLSPVFWLGAGFAMAIYSAYSDWLGREEFIRRIRDGWIDTSPWVWVPFAALFLGAAMWHTIRIGRKERVEIWGGSPLDEAMSVANDFLGLYEALHRVAYEGAGADEARAALDAFSRPRPPDRVPDPTDMG